MEKKILATRPYKTVYLENGKIVKVFTHAHGKANVFNEALCQARVEESGIEMPQILGVSNIDGQWALTIEYAEGKTIEELIAEDPVNTDKYLELFVDAQVNMMSKNAPRLTAQRDKFNRKISSLRNILDASNRYELHMQLDGMEIKSQLCHGDFVPSNVIVKKDGTTTIIDWAHATQGNGAGDAAITYLNLALKDQALADKYLDLFCKKTDTAKQYVLKWMPIAAAVQLTKGVPEEKEFLLKWAEVFDVE